MKFAAIDVGSNAVRLLLSKVISNGKSVQFKKEALVRIPLRLGGEAFLEGRLSPGLSGRLVQTMMGFRHLMEAYEPLDSLACATSAMRESANNEEIVDLIREKSGIDLKVVSGRQEAEIICSNHFEETLKKDGCYLYVDVGGGSTELTVLCNGKSRHSASFNIGTVRLLEGIVPHRRWTHLKRWLRKTRKNHKLRAVIGSGGNINKVYKLNQRKQGKPLSLKRMKRTRLQLTNYSLSERMSKLGLKPDRADVIVPATDIYISVMKWAGLRRIYVPQIGLSDGLIHIMYDRYLKKAEEEDSGPSADKNEIASFSDFEG